MKSETERGRRRWHAVNLLLRLSSSLALFGVMPAQADSFFPIVHAGDTFTGQLTLDPTTPIDPTLIEDIAVLGALLVFSSLSLAVIVLIY